MPRRTASATETRTMATVCIACSQRPRQPISHMRKARTIASRSFREAAKAISADRASTSQAAARKALLDRDENRQQRIGEGFKGGAVVDRRARDAVPFTASAIGRPMSGNMALSNDRGRRWPRITGQADFTRSATSAGSHLLQSASCVFRKLTARIVGRRPLSRAYRRAPTRSRAGRGIGLEEGGDLGRLLGEGLVGADDHPADRIGGRGGRLVGGHHRVPDRLVVGRLLEPREVEFAEEPGRSPVIEKHRPCSAARALSAAAASASPVPGRKLVKSPSRP